MEDHLHKIILRDENSHKGAFGHAFVVGGNKGYGGAAILAAKAAAFSGAGLIGPVSYTHLTLPTIYSV